MINMSFDKASLLNTQNLIDGLIAKATTGVCEAVNDTVNYIWFNAQERATNICGDYGISEQTKKYEANLLTMKGYVKCEHEWGELHEFGGTHSYEISPVNAKALSNINTIRPNYARFGPRSFVVHPPMPARPFMRPAATSGEIYMKFLIHALAGRKM
jgi:hypothetical protein